MDFSANAVLKENYTFLVTDADGMVGTPHTADGMVGAPYTADGDAAGAPAGTAADPTAETAAGVAAGSEHGLYSRDTRHLKRYRWRWSAEFQTLLCHSPQPDALELRHAELHHHGQGLALQRTLTLRADGLEERVQLENFDLEARELTLTLALDSDFADLFEARGWRGIERPDIERRADANGVRYAYRDADGATVATRLRFDPAPDACRPTEVRWTLRLAPGERRELRVEVALDNPWEAAAQAAATGTAAPAPPTYDAWRARFAPLLRGQPLHRRALLERAVDDLRALMLFPPEGELLAAGIPWYVAAFGRDALLSAHMLLDTAPEVAAGTLRYLAAHQGEVEDPFRAEQPGKIMHELRFGELTRRGAVPFGPYYGTVDATPLWLVLLHGHWRRCRDEALLRELRAPFEAALRWMTEWGDRDGDGFLEFQPAAPGGGLTVTGLQVQSWKDSAGSMSHADGSLATGALAVSEVQGYAYAAYEGAAELYEALGEPRLAGPWQERAERLRRDFHAAFWHDELGSYAMALDGHKRPLAVLNSDAGQLLWSGVVPPEAAPRLVESLFSEALWSGWGFRTLGAGEARYNPVSYHNGSVWPHDTALTAGGLARYGFEAEVARVREALLDLAASQPDRRAPELVAGYSRTPGAPPVPYPVACRPQAWDAAALVYLIGL